MLVLGSKLTSYGLIAKCEADLHGATSMMLTSYLLDRPGYMNDPVAEAAKNLLIANHCTSGTRLTGGCRTSIEIKMDDMEDARDVLGFHQVVTLGDHKRTVEGFCQMYGIKHVHSPRQPGM